MSIGFLSEAERARLTHFPTTISPTDLIQYFTLTPEDLAFIPTWSAASNRLGVALQLGALRLLGYFPADLTTAPDDVVQFVARQLDRRTTNQGLQRMAPSQRYPTLVAFLSQTLSDAIDEVLDRFDRCLGETEARARRDRDLFRQAVADATNEKVWLFRALGQVVLDTRIEDSVLRPAIYQQIPLEVLQKAIADTERIIRPLDDHALDFLARRYSYVRQFAPRFLETLEFRTHHPPYPLLNAVQRLRQPDNRI